MGDTSLNCNDVEFMSSTVYSFSKELLQLDKLITLVNVCCPSTKSTMFTNLNTYLLVKSY